MVSLYEGDEDGTHNVNDDGKIGEIYLNIDTIRDCLTGTDKDVASAIALLVHETVHVNNMSDKDERKEAKATGKDTREEKLADQIEDRTKDKVKTSDDTLTDEEFDNLQEELNASNKEKGREQKSLAQGTEAAKEVSGENKEKNPLVIVANPVVGGAIIIGTAYHQYEMANDPEYRKSIEQLNEAITEGTYKATAIVVDGVQKGWQIVTGDGQNYTLDKEAFDKLPENQKNVFYQNIPKIEEFVNGCSWEPVDESTYGEDNTKE